MKISKAKFSMAICAYLLSCKSANPSSHVKSLISGFSSRSNNVDPCLPYDDLDQDKALYLENHSMRLHGNKYADEKSGFAFFHQIEKGVEKSTLFRKGLTKLHVTVNPGDLKKAWNVLRPYLCDVKRSPFLSFKVARQKAFDYIMTSDLKSFEDEYLRRLHEKTKLLANQRLSVAQQIERLDELEEAEASDVEFIEMSAQQKARLALSGQITLYMHTNERLSDNTTPARSLNAVEIARYVQAMKDISALLKSHGVRPGGHGKIDLRFKNFPYFTGRIENLEDGIYISSNLTMEEIEEYYGSTVVTSPSKEPFFKAVLAVQGLD